MDEHDRRCAALYSVQAQFRTWLFTIAHNKTMDYFRANSKAEARLYSVADGEDAVDIEFPGARTEEPEVQTESDRARAAILKALDGLPAPQREAFLLSEEGGMTVAEIAEATGFHEAAKPFALCDCQVARAVAGLPDDPS